VVVFDCEVAPFFCWRFTADGAASSLSFEDLFIILETESVEPAEIQVSLAA